MYPMLFLYERERYISDETDSDINSVIKLGTIVTSKTFLPLARILPILAPRTIFSMKNNMYMILAFLLCFSQMYNEHSFTFKSRIQIHLEAISYVQHYFTCSEVHFR